MQMNSSKRFEVPRETDPVKEPSGNSKVDTVPHKGHWDEQTPPQNPVSPYIPDEGTFETFVCGAGI
jgi:hypothetical protein